MAMEQWEQDLRRQLEGVKPTVPANNNWNEIRYDEKKQTSNLLLITILLLFAVALYYCSEPYFDLHQCKPNCDILTPAKIEPLQVERNRPQVDLSPLKAEIEKLRLEQEQMNKRIRWNGERLTLLATVQQDNFLSIRNGNINFIYFNADWTIDKMPRYLELTPEDKEFLKKYIKN